MKYFLLVIGTLFLFTSCEDVEINSPAFQGELNETLFKAIDARAAINEDSTMVIQGISEKNTVTLKVPRFRIGSYELGSLPTTYATFEKNNIFYYNTNPDGDGLIVLSEIDTINKTVSGTFRFNAFAPNIDPINFQNGVFYQIPYDGGSVNNPNNQSAGNLTARLNGNIFSSFFVTAIPNADSITITGTNANKSITIKVPLTVDGGTYFLPMNGFNCFYKVGSQTQEATAGTVIIFSNNPVERTIKGTFSFETANNSITEGNFNVTY